MIFGQKCIIARVVRRDTWKYKFKFPKHYSWKVSSSINYIFAKNRFGTF